VSFADILKTTVASLPASRTQESNIITALACCRLVCNVRNISNDEIQHVWVASLPTQPTVEWVCLLCIFSFLEYHKSIALCASVTVLHIFSIVINYYFPVHVSCLHMSVR